MNVPHEVAMMGSALRAEVERQLLRDFQYYEPAAPGQPVSIDWSAALQEGHTATVLGGALESLSDVYLRDSAGEKVGDGWMEFVYGGVGHDLFVFWLFLKLRDAAGRWRDVRNEATIPEHIWKRLPEATKSVCGRDRKWSRDPKAVAWQRDLPPRE
jgi:hypothetical protein